MNDPAILAAGTKAGEINIPQARPNELVASNLNLAQAVNDLSAPPQDKEAIQQRARQLGIDTAREYPRAFQDQLSNISEVLTENWGVISASERLGQLHPEIKTLGQFLAVLKNTLTSEGNEYRFASDAAVQKTRSLLNIAQGALFTASKSDDMAERQKNSLDFASQYLNIYSEVLLDRYQKSNAVSNAIYPDAQLKEHGDLILNYEEYLGQIDELIQKSENILIQYTLQESPFVR